MYDTQRDTRMTDTTETNATHDHRKKTFVVATRASGMKMMTRTASASGGMRPSPISEDVVQTTTDNDEEQEENGSEENERSSLAGEGDTAQPRSASEDEASAESGIGGMSNNPNLIDA